MKFTAQIREMIEQGMTDAEIDGELDEGRCEAADAKRAERDYAGWTQADSNAMTVGYWPDYVINDAGEFGFA